MYILWVDRYYLLGISCGFSLWCREKNVPASMPDIPGEGFIVLHTILLALSY